jgi:hypothetical protein
MSSPVPASWMPHRRAPITQMSQSTLACAERPGGVRASGVRDYVCIPVSGWRPAGPCPPLRSTPCSLPAGPVSASRTRHRGVARHDRPATGLDQGAQAGMMAWYATPQGSQRRSTSGGRVVRGWLPGDGCPGNGPRGNPAQRMVCFRDCRRAGLGRGRGGRARTPPRPAPPSAQRCRLRAARKLRPCSVRARAVWFVASILSMKLSRRLSQSPLSITSDFSRK